MSSHGASAICTRKSFSARMSPMLALGTLRASEWKLSRMSPMAG